MTIYEPPAWATKGSEVAEYVTHTLAATVRMTTVASVTATQVITATGRPYSLRRRSFHGNSSLPGVGESTWELMAPNDPFVVRARAEQLLRDLTSAVHTLDRAQGSRDTRRDPLDVAREIEALAVQTREAIEALPALGREG